MTSAMLANFVQAAWGSRRFRDRAGVSLSPFGFARREQETRENPLETRTPEKMNPRSAVDS